MSRDVESSLNQRFAFLGRFCESSLEVRVEDNGFDSFIESSLYWGILKSKVIISKDILVILCIA